MPYGTLMGRSSAGETLRVDNAAGEKNKEELKSLGPAAPIIDSPYGDLSIQKML